MCTGTEFFPTAVGENLWPQGYQTTWNRRGKEASSFYFRDMTFFSYIAPHQRFKQFRWWGIKIYCFSYLVSALLLHNFWGSLVSLLLIFVLVSCKPVFVETPCYSCGHVLPTLEQTYRLTNYENSISTFWKDNQILDYFGHIPGNRI